MGEAKIMDGLQVLDAVVGTAVSNVLVSPAVVSIEESLVVGSGVESTVGVVMLAFIIVERLPTTNPEVESTTGLAILVFSAAVTLEKLLEPVSEVKSGVGDAMLVLVTAAVVEKLLVTVTAVSEVVEILAMIVEFSRTRTEEL